MRSFVTLFLMHIRFKDKSLHFSGFHFLTAQCFYQSHCTKVTQRASFVTWHLRFGGVSSVPFPFRFPFQSYCELVSSGISSQSVQNILIWCVTWNKRPNLVLSHLRFSEMTSELITFNHLRCHSSSTALGTRTDYWKLTWRQAAHWLRRK